MNRTDHNGTVQSAFTYHYQPNTNKLSSVNGYATYEYDDLGQPVKINKADRDFFLSYHVSGKLTGIYSDAARTQLVISFGYDESGNRIRKTDHSQDVSTYYVTDASGNVLAIYDNNGSSLQQKEVPVYAAGRIGIYQKQSGAYWYELSDHLGNVRAVIGQNKTSSGLADVAYYSDYYPFGSTLTYQGSVGYRYGYQGQFAETDKESAWVSFALRMYDPVVGRWMTTDPYGQYHSPYVGMGNDPVNGVDPDGGFDTWFGAFIYSIFNGGSVSKNSDGKYQVGKIGYYEYNGKIIPEAQIVTRRNGVGINYMRNYAWNSPQRRLLTGDKLGLSIGFDATAFAGSSINFEINWLLTGKDASLSPYIGVTTAANAANGITASVDLSFSKSWHSGSRNNVLAESLPGLEYGGSVGGKLLLGGDVGYSYSKDGKYGWHTATVGAGLGIDGSPFTVVNVKGSISNNLFQYHTGTGRLYER